MSNTKGGCCNELSNCISSTKVVSPVCDFKLILTMNIRGTRILNNTILPGTITRRLETCSDDIVFDNICDKSNILIMGIPIIFNEKNNIYAIDAVNVKTLFDNSPGSVLILRDVIANRVLKYTIEISNGYIYFIFQLSDINPDFLTSLAQCCSKLAFTFDFFSLSVIPLDSCCNSPCCNPITWNIGYTEGPRTN